MILRCLATLSLLLLSECLRKDIAPQFVSGRDAHEMTMLASGREFAVCVVTVYQTRPGLEPPTLLAHFEPWSRTQIEQRVDEMAIEGRVLSNAMECWGDEIKAATRAPDPFSYLERAKLMNAFDHAAHVAIFDPQRHLFLALQG
ncbi:hypothetical protein C8J30_103133 [Rhodobacter viridis]|uniref:Uncharacterized protein n=1 Tax=Rhodobacter viridis TaxID=1054202 RepID=A0A318U534_9RHOB|nr:hypothetical protein C8J30_103133 [Rhodobacter viridis]